MGNPINQSAFIRTSRNFPADLKQLAIEVNRAYVDIANAVNYRTIGLYPSTEVAITGNRYFFSALLQQSVRKAYSFTSTSSINHGLANYQPGFVVTAFGSYTDGTNDYGLLYKSSGTITTEIGFYITSTQIVFVVGGSAPSLTEGKIVIEYLSAP